MTGNVKRCTISLPADLLTAAEKRADVLKYKNFSEYISFLISSDVHEKPKHLLFREEKGVTYGKEQPRMEPHRMEDNLKEKA